MEKWELLKGFWDKTGHTHMNMAIDTKGEWIIKPVFETMDDFVFQYERNYMYWINILPIIIEIPYKDPYLMYDIDY